MVERASNLRSFTWSCFWCWCSTVQFSARAGDGKNVEEQAALPSHAELEGLERDPLALRALQGPWRDEVRSDTFSQKLISWVFNDQPCECAVVGA